MSHSAESRWATTLRGVARQSWNLPAHDRVPPSQEGGLYDFRRSVDRRVASATF